MFYNAKSHTLKIADTTMDYVSFGKGNKPLVLIPGLNAKDVKGAEIPLAYMYRIFAKEYKVYVFDRKAMIPEGYTVKDMAKDLADAMQALGIAKAHVVGVSQGGMIAQYLAIEYPQLVEKLVLAVTLSRNNSTVEEVVGRWIEFVDGDDFRAMSMDMLEKMYSDAYIRKYRWTFGLFAKLSIPKDVTRFKRLAKACLTCNAYEELDKIKCPVLVIGGKLDKVVTVEASEDIAEKLGCEIFMYKDLGHSAYEEASDFNRKVYEFFVCDI